MGDFEAYNSRWRIALLVLGAIAFVLVGLWAVGRFSSRVTFVVGWLCVVFFGLCGIATLKKLFDSSVQLRIGHSGVRWRPWSDKLIPWSEIVEVTTWSHQGQNVIILHLSNPARFPARGLAAKLASANRMLTGGNIPMSLTCTDRNYDDAMSAIEHFRC